MVNVVRDGPARLFLCACCRVQVIVCSHCDRGQRYCAGDCAQRTRQRLQGQAAKRYQNSLKGRHRHAQRMHRWREQRRAQANKVTHQGCMITPANDVLVVYPTRQPICTPLPSNNAPFLPIPPAPPAWLTPAPWRCGWCAAALPIPVRWSFLRWQRGLDP